MKKCILLLSLIMIAAAVFAGGGSEAAEGKAVELKFAHYLAEDHAAHIAALAFKKAVEERTNGMVTITIFPSSKLGNSQDLVEQTIEGAIDLVIPTEPAIGKWVNIFNMVGAPFAFKDYAAADKFYNSGFMKEVEPMIEAVGLKYLARWEYGFRNYTSSVRLLMTPDDFAGLKIRTPPDFVNSATVNALGGTAQTIAWTELPMALKQGVVDGQENPIATILSAKMYETQKYLSVVNYTYNSTLLLMNLAKYNSLSADAQKIIMEEAVKAGKAMQKSVRDKEAEQIKELEANGMEVAYPDTAPFAAKAAPVYDELKAKVGEKDYDLFMKYLDMSRK